MFTVAGIVEGPGFVSRRLGAISVFKEISERIVYDLRCELGFFQSHLIAVIACFDELRGN